MARKNRKKNFYNISVIDAGAKGKSIAKAPDGKVIFINNAVPGDIVDVQTFKKRKGFYEGTATKVHELSKHRINASCDHFGNCGGCKWQNMSYSRQLYHKDKEVKNNLERIGKLKINNIIPIQGSDKIFFYRNKMEFSFSNNRWLTMDEVESKEPLNQRNGLGFHIPGMWDKILDINKCWLQKDPSNDIRNKLKSFAIEKKIPFFDPKKQIGVLRTLMIRTSSIGHIMVVVQFYSGSQKVIDIILNYLKTTFPYINSLQYVVNNKCNDTIYDQEVICFYGKDYIMEEMEGLKFKINAKSFYQTNSEQAYELYKIAREFAELSGNELVYDLYTGIGTIAQFIAKKAKKVVGVESVKEAVIAAKQNAILNKIDNVDFFVGDMKKIFNDNFININGTPDIIIADPPRNGMHIDVVKQILKIGPEKVIYISCNSATQARDLFFMSSQYQIIKSQAVDMFPQTHHVENVVLLKKIN
tara:strand:- start:240 stop:1652 length:1413 start_codon:yes stop_codon:yes gene_type:complete